MKNRMTTIVLVAPFAVFMLADVASAYYSPRLGRFLSRDPLNEQGAVLTRRVASGRFLPRDPLDPISRKYYLKSAEKNRFPYSAERSRYHDAAEGNLYHFVDNDPVSSVDILGLDRWIIWEGVHSALIYQVPGGCYRIEIKMQVNKFYEWWHWPKDAFQLALNACLCGTVGGAGEVQKRRVSCPTTPPDMTTSADEDAILHEKYSQGDLVYYNVWLRNCNTFTAVEQNTGYNPKPKPNPTCNQTLTPCNLYQLGWF
jgi:hypothetical protein